MEGSGCMGKIVNRKRMPVQLPLDSDTLMRKNQKNQRKLWTLVLRDWNDYLLLRTGLNYGLAQALSRIIKRVSLYYDSESTKKKDLLLGSSLALNCFFYCDCVLKYQTSRATVR